MPEPTAGEQLHVETDRRLRHHVEKHMSSVSTKPTHTDTTIYQAIVKRLLRVGALMVAVGAMIASAPASVTALTTSNDTPFPSSTVISAAHWSSLRHGPPSNQFGDILPMAWGDDNNLYVLMDDGGTDPPQRGALWRNSFARITGQPLQNLRFQRIGNAPPPATWSQIRHNRSLWSGPLGSYYSTGFTSVNHVFYATQVSDWDWSNDGLFTGLAGIAYSTDHGAHWSFPSKPFPGPTGNLNWVQRGRDATAPDGYVYSISTEREFNATTLILGRSRPGIATMTDPSQWQWASGWEATPSPWPQWSGSINSAQPILSWPGHITYPRMSYVPGLRRYLLTFTWSFASTPPGIWQNGSELEILDAPHPWGPFSFVSRGPYFGPSNGYDPAIPVKWISNHGQDLWMVWAANFDGCAAGLSCSAGYGFNYQRMHLTLAATHAASAARAHRRVAVRPKPPRRWRNLPATPPPVQLPRLHLSPR
jgi:hypothetical protein